MAACGGCCNCDSPNVKTVLFKKMDLQRDCWEHSDVALLLTRRLMQELVPRKVPVNVPLMREYFDLAQSAVDQTATSNASRMALQAAFADTTGGYLHAYGLPLAKEAYYEGKTDYKEMKLLHDLLTRLKSSLGTDGQGWRTSTSVNKFASKVAPLKIAKITNDRDPCESLITNDIIATPRPKNREARQTSQSCCSEGTLITDKTPPEDVMRIPLPFLDDDRSPRALALPFKNKSLFSLTSPVSIEVLSNYYTASVSCLKSTALAALGPPQSKFCQKIARSRSTQNILRDATEKFEVYFYRWINDKIIPHLDDEVWYVGFGGILRITETIRRKGFQLLNETGAISGTTSPRIGEGSTVYASSSSSRDLREHGTRLFPQQPMIFQFPEHPSTSFYLCSICLIILSFWLISSLFYVFYKVCRNKSPKRSVSIASIEGSDLYKHILNSEDTDTEGFVSEEEERLLRSSIIRGESPRYLSGLDSSLTDLYDKYLSDDQDIAVSSTGISYILSDGTGVTTGKLSSTKNKNDDFIIRKTETRKENVNKKCLD